ncbi:hypothetical protein DY000_02023840 [Brassica cretica]|uniref:Uncharacterized protein n=1 Tax=Brassica cretica TaxID=69181 RepID=A0ABQ7EMN4_BRACR|nr:hypothetical protein DY000_02023840 [Brassica cretica]
MSLDGSGGMAMAYTARKFHRENMKILTATTTVGGGIEENGRGYTRWFFGKLSTKKKSAKRVSLSEHANHLRKQTLKQMSRILTTKQAARGFLALGEYFQRLRALREENKEKRSTRKKSQLPRVMLARDLFILRAPAALRHIPRSKNAPMDHLAKETRIKGFIFSHID